MRLFQITTSLVLFSNPLLGAQIHSLQSEKRIECMISDTQVNRIQVEGDRIAAVYGGHSNYVIETDEVGGQIFLKAIHGGATGGTGDHATGSSATSGLYLSLLTEDDVTQDLKLTPAPVDAQTLVFKPGMGISNHGLETRGCPGGLDSAGEVYTSRLIHLIKELALGSGDKVVEDNDKRSNSVGLNVICKKQLVINGFLSQVFEVENQGTASLTLDPEMISKVTKTPALALAVEKFVLAPGQKTKLFIVSKDAGATGTSATRIKDTSAKDTSVGNTSVGGA